jgi:hypothetical protein
MPAGGTLPFSTFLRLTLTHGRKVLIDLLRRSFVSPKPPLRPINSYLARHLT